MMRKVVWILLVVATLILSACGPALTPPGDGKTKSGEMFLIALPRIVIDFDAEGNPSVLGMNLADAGRLLGQDLSGLSLKDVYLTPDLRLIDSLIAANVQHIELRHTGDGVAALVNGKVLPHIAWSGESLQMATDVAAMFNVQGLDTVRKILPIVQRLGMNIVLNFPIQAGAEKIALADPSAAISAPQAEESPTTAVLKFEVKYDDQGVPSILGISARDLPNAEQLKIALAPDVILKLQENDVQYMELRNKPDGLYIYANGQPLPNLVWDNDLLVNASDLYAQMNPTSPYVTWVKQFVPAINNLDVDILLHFPLAADVQAIKVETH